MSYASLLINSCTVERHSQANIVIGTDGNDYYCAFAHTATVNDTPITGFDYWKYWKPTGGTGAGVAWVLGNAYVASLTTDDYGNPVVVWVPATGLGDEPCRLMATKGIELTIGAEVVVANYKLFLGDVTITEQDRIWVYAGTIKGWALYEILLVEDKQDSADSHHKECYLKSVR